MYSEYLNQGISSLRRAKQGFINPPPPNGNELQQYLDTIAILKNVRGANEMAFGQQATNHPQVMWGGEMRVKGTPNLNALARQEGKYGTMMRSKNPYQGSLDQPGNWVISVVKKGGDVVKRYRFKSLNEAENARQRIPLKEGESMFSPQEWKI